MPKSDEQLMATYRELTAGLHKTGLAVHGIAITQENHAERLSGLETTVQNGDNSLQTRIKVLENEVDELKKARAKQQEKGTALAQAQIQGKATVAAAWIGLFGGLIAAIVALIAAFK